MTSFQKKARVKVSSIPGTRPSIYNNQLLVSTGIPSLDNVIGGGLAVGTVLLVEEDAFGSYAKLMLKYFTAEAIVSQQTVLLCSGHEHPEHLIQELPAPIDTVHRSELKEAVNSMQMLEQERSDAQSEGSEDSKMKIAWRYQNQPKVKSTLISGVQFGHYYDLTKVMDEKTIDSGHINYSTPLTEDLDLTESSTQLLKNNAYCKLLEDIQNQISQGFETSEKTDKRRILRIAIHSLGSPLWGENGGIKQSCEQTMDPSLPQFFIALRAKLRTALAVAMVTVPAHVFSDKGFLHRVERLCDTVVRLESFAGSAKEKNPVFKEYHGLMTLVQLPRLGSLVTAQPMTSDLAFKLRRKKLTIEKLHLPPELGDTQGRAQEEEARGGCGGGDAKGKLSF